MSYTGPTRIDRDEYTQLQQRKFQQAAATIETPAEPLRVENEQAKFKEFASSLPHPADELRVQDEQQRFAQLAGEIEPPRVEIPETPPEAPPSASPADLPPADAPPPSAGGADDPVARTLQFLGVQKQQPRMDTAAELAKFRDLTAEMGITPGAEDKAVIGEGQEPQDDQQQPFTPDVPGLPFAGPGLPAFIPNKPTQISDEVRRKMLADEPLSVQDFVDSATAAAQNQNSSSPAALEGNAPGIHLGTSEEQLARGFARGLTETGGEGRGGLERLVDAASGEVGQIDPRVAAILAAGGGAGALAYDRLTSEDRPTPDPLENPTIARMLDKSENAPSPLLDAANAIGNLAGRGLDALGGMSREAADNLSALRHGVPGGLDAQRARVAAGGPLLTDEEIAQGLARVEPFALSMTGEPLKAVGGAANALRGVARDGEALGQPGLSLQETPDSRDFSRYMEYKRDQAARARARGETPPPVREGDPTSMRAYDEWLGEQERIADEELRSSGRGLPAAAADEEIPLPEPDEAVLATKKELLESLNRGDLLAQLRRLNANKTEAKQGAFSALTGGEPPAHPGPLEGPVVQSEMLPAKPKSAYTMPTNPGPLGTGTLADVEQARLEGASAGPPKNPGPLGPMKDVAQARMSGPFLENIPDQGEIGRWGRMWKRTRDVIADPVNGEFGQQLSRMVHDVRETEQTMAGPWHAALVEAGSRTLSKAEKTNLVDVVEQGAKPVSPKVQQVAAVWNALSQEIRDRARKAGLNVGKIENYYPHMWAPGTFNGENRARLLNELVRTGQAQDVLEAKAILDQARAYGPQYRSAGNLEKARTTDLDSYVRSPDVLHAYIDSAAQRIAGAEMFGPKNELADDLIRRIGLDGGDENVARQMFDIAMRFAQYDPVATKVSGAIRAVESAMHLGLSAIGNMGQSVNTIAVAGAGNVAKNAKRAFSREGYLEALRAGVVNPGSLEDLREGSGAGRVLGKVTAPGFRHVEEPNRVLAYLSGASYGDEMGMMAAKGDEAAQKALTGLGLDAKAIIDRGGQLTEPERIAAGRSMVERTQFMVDPQDLPYWASSPPGRLVAQFRTFSMGQQRFLWNELIRPALEDKRIGPVARYLLFGAPVGMALNTAYDVASGRGVDTDPLSAIPQGIGRVGGFGLLGDVIRGGRNVFNGKMTDSQAAARIGGLMGGPAISDGLTAVAAAHSALMERKPGSTADPYLPAKRFVLGAIPVIGPAAQNTFAPYAGREEGSGFTIPASSGRSSSRSGGRSSGGGRSRN